jgi:hypothetical protein
VTPNIQRLIYTESGGFAGLRRGCTVDAHSLPQEPSQQLSGLLAKPQALQAGSVIAANMPDQLLYTLELVTEPSDTPNTGVAKVAAKKTPAPKTRSRAKTKPTPSPWVLRYSASSVPEDLAALMDYLHDQAKPL